MGLGSSFATSLYKRHVTDEDLFMSERSPRNNRNRRSVCRKVQFAESRGQLCLLQVYIVYRVSFIFRLNVFFVSVCTKGFAYLLCRPRGRGLGHLVCKRRFSFHEFYNFLLFIFFTHDIYPHPRHTTSTHYVPTSHDI